MRTYKIDNMYWLGLFVLLMSHLSQAQGKSQLALRIGLNNAKIIQTDLHTKQGLYAGLALSVKLSDTYVLQPELGYSRQGGASENNNTDDININYISIGLTNKFFTKNHGFHFMLGPSIAVNYDDNILYLTNNTAENFKLTPVDLNLMGGVGVQFSSGLGIELRYKQGLIDLDFNDNGAYGSSAEKAQLNKVVQIGIYYGLKF